MPDEDFSKTNPASNNNSRHGYAVSKDQKQFPRVYRIWRAMIQRTSDPNAQNYARYGGKGIAVCERWKTFANFLADMGECPSEKHSIERKDADGNYEKSNCKWATNTEQANNQRRTVRRTIRGITGTLAQLCVHFGVPYCRTKMRLKKCNDLEKAIFGARPNAKLTWDNVHKIRSMRGQLPTDEIAAQFGISKSMVLMIHANKVWVAPVK